jgi:hypothetical protein
MTHDFAPGDRVRNRHMHDYDLGTIVDDPGRRHGTVAMVYDFSGSQVWYIDPYFLDLVATAAEMDAEAER